MWTKKSLRMAQEASNVLLANTWDESIDPTGWWMSEKLDGIRAYWSGSALYSRQGNTFVAPDYWKNDLPNVPLDGELWYNFWLLDLSCALWLQTFDSNFVLDWWASHLFVVCAAPFVVCAASLLRCLLMSLVAAGSRGGGNRSYVGSVAERKLLHSLRLSNFDEGGKGFVSPTSA